jgi:hypothetical protein
MCGNTAVEAKSYHFALLTGQICYKLEVYHFDKFTSEKVCTDVDIVKK